MKCKGAMSDNTKSTTSKFLTKRLDNTKSTTKLSHIRELCVIQKSPYMKNKCFILTVLVFLIGLAQLQAQQVIRLYPGKAPGSEN